MLTVIFGAGASHDAVPSDQRVVGKLRPPLAKHLFANQFGPWLAKYPPVRGLASTVLASDKALEDVLQIEMEDADHDDLIHQRLMAARYYLRDVIEECTADSLEMSSHMTNYITLVQEIQKWQIRSEEDVCYVTFNYDTLLEDAICAVYNCKLDHPSQYTTQRTFSVIKPHGSISWMLESQWTPEHVGHVINQDVDLEFAIENAADFRSGDIVPFDFETRNRDRLYVPAIAIPTRTKSDSTFVLNVPQRETFLNALKESSRTLVVGWAGAENHFLDLWSKRKNPKSKTYCVDISRDAAYGVKGNLRTGKVLGDFHHLYDGFTKWTKSGEIRSFLDGHSQGVILG